MGDVVAIKPAPPVEDHEFVVDLARFRENLLDEKSIRRKYRFDAATWLALGNDDELIRKVEQESIRRVRDGSSKREKSQQLVVKAPDVLSSILLDNTANARHRIDSAKTLNDFAANGPAAVGEQSDRFIITINLSDGAGGEPKILHFDKPIAIDVDPLNNTNTTLEESAFAASKKEDGGGEFI
jgi:hypothetical protein